jgi:hypothetical protein
MLLQQSHCSYPQSESDYSFKGFSLCVVCVLCSLTSWYTGNTLRNNSLHYLRALYRHLYVGKKQKNFVTITDKTA